jgi:serine/threonine protein phosphatase PrpC
VLLAALRAMGCAKTKQVQVIENRRRLSVGHVEASDNDATAGEVTEDDRGLLTQLSESALMEMLEKQDLADGGRKMSVGTAEDSSKTSFANKRTQEMGDQIDTEALGIGYTCRKGLKPESPNQDSWFMLKMETQSIYAVFDGHGKEGHHVSNFVKDNLPKLLIKDNRFRKPADVPQMMTDVFKKTQNLIVTADRMKKFSAQLSGTTATVAIHDHSEDKITVAHVADSTCVLGRIVPGEKELEGVALTRDHKPDLKDEKARIEKSGGRVVFDGYANHRVYAKNARYPGLNMSRCLGDLMGHADCGISCEPEVKEHKVDKAQDKVLLLCSDGVWEFVTPSEAVQVVGKMPSQKADKAAECLAKESWDRWIHNEGGAVVDDITVVLVYLFPDT